MSWGDVLSGGLGAIGSAIQSGVSYKIAKENREWQERMSNTAMQRAAADAEAAGLNRIIALGKPATTPGGNVSAVGNALGEGVSAYNRSKLARTSSDLLSAQGEIASAQGHKARVEGKIWRKLDGLIDKWSPQVDSLFQQWLEPQSAKRRDVIDQILETPKDADSGMGFLWHLINYGQLESHGGSRK